MQGFSQGKGIRRAGASGRMPYILFFRRLHFFFHPIRDVINIEMYFSARAGLRFIIFDNIICMSVVLYGCLGYVLEIIGVENIEFLAYINNFEGFFK